MNKKEQQLQYALMQAVYLSSLLNVNVPIDFEILDDHVINPETNEEATLEDLIFIIDTIISNQEFILEEPDEIEEHENSEMEEKKKNSYTAICSDRKDDFIELREKIRELLRREDARS